MSLFDALEKMSRRFDELDRLLADPEVIADQSLFTSLLRERGALESKVQTYRAYRSAARELEDIKSDPEMRALFEDEIPERETDLQRRELELRELFVMDDADADRNVILEIRAGTGGDEAALFAGDLLRMYASFAEAQGWKSEILEANAGTVGGFKEVIVNVVGKHAFKWLRYESGGHRVQRVPETETQGRIHTSAATVAVLPEASEVDVKIEEKDLKIETFRSSGPGGQSVNKTSSAIRIKHLPTGLVVSCQDEKSQHKNRAKALKILASRLYDEEARRAQNERSSTRRALIGSGDRSQRIRTYNFPQNRVTDHRIGLTLYALDRVLQGDLRPVIEPLMEHDKEQKLLELDEQGD